MHKLISNIVVALVFIVFGSCSSSDPEKRADFKQIIEQIKSGILIPSSDGVVKLPSNLTGATIYGEVYVTKKKSPKGILLLIVFPSWEGKGFNIRGYLYCDIPLTNSDICKSYDQKDAIEIWRTLGDRGAWAAITLDEKISPNWYYISRSLD